jgi:hypothetical protein
MALVSVPAEISDDIMPTAMSDLYASRTTTSKAPGMALIEILWRVPNMPRAVP